MSETKTTKDVKLPLKPKKPAKVLNKTKMPPKPVIKEVVPKKAAPKKVKPILKQTPKERRAEFQKETLASFLEKRFLPHVQEHISFMRNTQPSTGCSVITPIYASIPIFLKLKVTVETLFDEPVYTVDGYINFFNSTDEKYTGQVFRLSRNINMSYFPMFKKVSSEFAAYLDFIKSGVNQTFFIGGQLLIPNSFINREAKDVYKETFDTFVKKITERDPSEKDAEKDFLQHMKEVYIKNKFDFLKDLSFFEKKSFVEHFNIEHFGVVLAHLRYISNLIRLKDYGFNVPLDDLVISPLETDNIMNRTRRMIHSTRYLIEGLNIHTASGGVKIKTPELVDLHTFISYPIKTPSEIED